VGVCTGPRWRSLVNAVMNLWVPWNEGNFLTSRKLVSFTRRALLHGLSKYTVYYKIMNLWMNHTIYTSYWTSDFKLETY
jgi:hypothetical protein